MKITVEMMQEAHKLIKEEEKDNIVTFEPKLITGGRDNGGSEDGVCWLLGLEEKTAFIVEETNVGQTMPRWAVAQYYLVKKFPKAVMLVNSQQQEIFVNPYRFSNAYRLYDMLYDPKTMPPIETEKEETDGQSDRNEPEQSQPDGQLESPQGPES